MEERLQGPLVKSHIQVEQYRVHYSCGQWIRSESCWGECGLTDPVYMCFVDMKQACRAVFSQHHVIHIISG